MQIRDRIASYSIDYVAQFPDLFPTESTAGPWRMKFTIVYDWLRTGRVPAVDSVAKFPGDFATESTKYKAILSEKKFCCLHTEYMILSERNSAVFTHNIYI